MVMTDKTWEIVGYIFVLMIVIGILKIVWRIAKAFIKVALYVAPIVITFIFFQETLALGIVTALLSVIYYFILHKIKTFFEGMKFRRMVKKYG